METTAGDIIILHMCTKNHNYMRYSSWDTEWVSQKNLSFWAIFCPFTPLTTWKTKILEKMKKASFYTCVPKIMICYMLLEIWSATDTIFCCFGSFFALLSHYIDPEKKLEKNLGDIILLHMCTINENHMMHGSWDIKAQGIEFLAIWGHFLPFDPLTTPKIKFLKKWKTLLEISSFYTSVHHKWQSYDVWFLKYEACRQNLSFSLFLPFYCSNSPKNQNKKKKNNLQVSFCT